MNQYLDIYTASWPVQCLLCWAWYAGQWLVGPRSHPWMEGWCRGTSHCREDSEHRFSSQNINVPSAQHNTIYSGQNSFLIPGNGDLYWRPDQQTPPLRVSLTLTWNGEVYYRIAWRETVPNSIQRPKIIYIIGRFGFQIFIHQEVCF